jgi:hypothetical protein
MGHVTQWGVAQIPSRIRTGTLRKMPTSAEASVYAILHAPGGSGRSKPRAQPSVLSAGSRGQREALVDRLALYGDNAPRVVSRTDPE